MPLFQFRAVTAASEVTEGRMEAPDPRALVDRLHALGHVPLHIEPVGSSLFSRLRRVELLPARRLRPRSLALISGQLALLLRAGLPLDEALRTLEGIAAGDFDKRCIGRLVERISAGMGLADAMAAQGPAFPEYCISIVRAGEASASLDTVLERLTEFIERAEGTKEHLKSALLYPAFVALACCLSIAVLLLIVVPQLRPLFEESGQQLPLSARFLLALSELLQNYWWAGIACLLLLIALGLWYGRRPAFRIWRDHHILRLPLAGDLTRKIEAARFCRILGTLLKNGVPLLAALSITRSTTRNAAIRDAIGSIIESVTVGRGLAEPLRQTQVFPQLAEQLVRIGEETACQEEMLGKIADLLEVDTRRRIDRLLTLVTPAVTIILGLIIAGVTMSIMSALLSVYSLAL
jgi:general secretion pathway protein F